MARLNSLLLPFAYCCVCACDGAHEVHDAGNADALQTVDGGADRKSDASPPDARDPRGREVVVEDQGSPSELLLDGDFMVWSNYDDGLLHRAKKDGTDVQTLSKGIRFRPSPIALDSQNVFFSAGIEGGKGAIFRLPKDRSPGERLTLLDIGAEILAAPAESQTTIYFTIPADGASELRRIVSPGPSTSNLVAPINGQTPRLIGDGSSIFFAENRQEPGFKGSVLRYGKADGSVVVVAREQETVAAIWVDDQSVFWAEGFMSRNDIGGGLFGRINKKAKSALESIPPTVLATKRPSVGQITGDETNLYLLDVGEGRIFRMPKDGSSAPVLMTSGGLPRAIAVDDKYLYWTQGDLVYGGIWRMPK